MNKTVLLTAASVIALGAANAFAGPPLRPFSDKSVFLWNQNSNDAGTNIASMNYTSGTSSSYNNQGADDFVIPKGSRWRIKKVDVTGVYGNRGPVTSENVIFYKDKKGMPGVPVKNGTFDNLNGGSGPRFSIALPGRGLKLRSGQYWVSVVANVNYYYGGWFWEVSGVQHKDQAMWQNPGGGFGVCQTWGTIENCLAQGPDLMFDLRGQRE